MTNSGLSKAIGVTIDSSRDGFVPMNAATAFENTMIIPASVHEEQPLVPIPSSREARDRALLMLHSGREATLTASMNLDAETKGQIAAWKGLLGTILVDCSLFKTAAEYRQFVAQSPFKGTLQYAIHCRCGHTIRTEKKSSVEASLDPIGAALGAVNPVMEEHCHCKKMGLPVLANPADYRVADAFDLIQTVVERGQIETVTAKKYIAKISTTGKPLEAVRQLFREVASRLSAIDENECLATPIVGQAMKPSEIFVRIPTAKKDVTVATSLDKPVELVSEGEQSSIQIVPRKDVSVPIDVTKTAQPVGSVTLKKMGVSIHKYEGHISSMEVDGKEGSMPIGRLESRKGSIEVDGSEMVDTTQFENQPLELTLDAHTRGELDVIGSEQLNISF